MQDELGLIARNTVLRVAINTGNRALVQQKDGQLMGVSPALARRLADRLGVTFEPVMYSGAGKVFADAQADQWDVAFLAIDETRARKVCFTRPYHLIEATYAVRATSDIHQIADADREGLEILTATGSAYDMYLSETLTKAQLVHSGTPSESFEEFRGGRGDLVAGVRASLEGYFGDDDDFRIMPGYLTQVAQAMALVGAENPLIAALDAFVADAIESGFVAQELVN